MTLTEEQREAIRVISKLPMAIGCQLCHPYIMENYGSHFIVLRDMIDSSGTVETTGGFDLERARGLRDFLQDDCAEVGDVWGEMIAEIERLRASLIDLHAEYINTLEKNPGCSAWDLDEQSDADQRRLRRNAAHAISIVEPPIYLQADQQVAKILKKHVALKKLGKMVRQRGKWLMEERANKMIQSDDCTQNEDAADFHHRCICEYNVKKCPIEQWWLNRARITLQAEGKIGNSEHFTDASKMIWQITEERVAALVAMSSLRTDVDCPQCDAWLHFSDIAEHAPVLRAMLTEAEQCE
ncbi:MAG: hypothetical protein PHU54_10090 [Candidatus Omnitrophica bacterium]|nr:hypothetical protein [Candidatus Omnitrophota bacterium]